MLPRANYGALFARAADAGATCVLDLPDDVERVLGLDRSYPVLMNAAVPTPHTAFLPVDDGIAARGEAIENSVRAIVPALLATELPASHVADIAFVRGGQPVVLELNPLYAAGYNISPPRPTS